MSDSESVIDLTSSLRRAAHNALNNIVIVLDDSLNNADEQAIDLTNLTVQVLDDSVQIPQRRTPHNKTKRRTKKRQQLNTAGESQIRERSPLRSSHDCPICYERLGTNPLVSTKCGHVFCRSCLESSLGMEKKCPTCRNPLRGKTAYHPLYLN